MPWIFEANIGDTDPPDRWGEWRKLNAEIQQTLNVAAHEGKTEVTFASCETSAPFTKACFTRMAMTMKNGKSFYLLGHWCPSKPAHPTNGVRFSLANAAYFSKYGDTMRPPPSGTPSPAEPIATVDSSVPVYQ